jgi:deoxyribodipyrimidine photo-lyase
MPPASCTTGKDVTAVSFANTCFRLALGEAYFAGKLLDYELSSNNGTGNGQQDRLDAAPWFRIFNPLTQQKKFDRDDDMSRNGCLAGKPDTLPCCRHETARRRLLNLWQRHEKRAAGTGGKSGS